MTSKRMKIAYPQKRRPIRRIAIELKSYANAYITFPMNRTMLLNTRGSKYDLFDQALKYTEENTCATAIDPITIPQTVAAAPRLIE
jgi:hypothetical protein